MIEIRAAHTDDASACCSIFNQAIARGKNAHAQQLTREAGKVWYNRLYEQALSLLVAEKSNEVIGWGGLTAYRSERGGLSHVVEVTFYVHDDHHRKGVGRMLLKELEQRALRDKKTVLVAILLDNNVASKALLESEGFKIWANFEDLVHLENGNAGHLYMGKHIK